MIGSPSASVPKLTQVHRSGEARERQAQVSHHDPLGELCATLQMVIDFDFSSINTSVTCSALETSLALLEATGGKLKKLLVRTLCPYDDADEVPMCERVVLDAHLCSGTGAVLSN